MKRTMRRLFSALLVMALLLAIAPTATAAETVSISQLYYDTEGRQIASSSNNECLITSYEALNSRATVTGLENAEVGENCTITVNADGLTTDGFPYILDGTQRFVLSEVYLIYGASMDEDEDDDITDITLPISSNDNINNSGIAEDSQKSWTSNTFILPEKDFSDIASWYPSELQVYQLTLKWKLDASTVVKMHNATFNFNCPENATIYRGSTSNIEGFYPIVITEFDNTHYQITDETITVKKPVDIAFTLNPKTDTDIVDMIGVKTSGGTTTYYQFLGWELQGDTAQKLYSMTDSVTMGEADMVFDAQWKQLSESDLVKTFGPGEAPNVPLSVFDARIEQTADGKNWSANSEKNPLELGADGKVSYRATLTMNNFTALALEEAGKIESKEFAHFEIEVSLDSVLKLVGDKDANVTFSFTCTFLEPSGELIVDGTEIGDITMETSGTKYTFTVPVSRLTDEEGNVRSFKIPVDWKPGEYTREVLQEKIVLEVISGAAPTSYDQMIETTGVITGRIDPHESEKMERHINTFGALYLRTEESWYNAFGQGKTLLDYIQAGYYLGDTAFSNITIPANTVYAKLGQVTITPADITIYTGGESYEGVVDGSEIDAGNGFPVPGFLLTLPETINEDYFEGDSEAQDLSSRVRFVYDGDEDGAYTSENDRIWELELYSDIGTSVTSPEDGVARYVYKIAKDKINGIPLRMKIYEDEDNPNDFITSDDFTTDLDMLYKTLYMTVYSGGLTTSKIKAEIMIDGEWVPFAVNVGTATLTVRGTTNQEQVIPVGNDTDSVIGNIDVFDEETGCTVTVVAEGDTAYYVNESQVSVDPAHVSLLSDGVVSTEPLYDYLMKYDLTDSDSNYLYRYLDLVDQTNGRAWITASKPVDVYWKVPDGTDRSSEFKIIHFEGLDREYDIEDLEQKLGDNLHIYSTEDGSIELVRLEDGDWYLKYATTTFSPFVLVWEDANNSWPPIIPEIPDVDIPNWLNLDDHYAYIIGYDDGMVKPQNNITRAEVATIFFRLLTDDARAYYWSTDSGFSDVKSGDWFNNAVSTMVSAGIINGYPDGTFRPNATITRAEFATIAARFLSNPYSLNDQFYDTEGHWAEVYINRAAEADWIDGYPDGTFRPDQAITRAEAMKLVNAVLGRAPHEDHLLPDMIVWPDNPKSAWYYEDVQEATNSHDYVWSSSKSYEIWTELLENRNWSKLEKEWSNAYSAPGGQVMD